MQDILPEVEQKEHHLEVIRDCESKIEKLTGELDSLRETIKHHQNAVAKLQGIINFTVDSCLDALNALGNKAIAKEILEWLIKNKGLVVVRTQAVTMQLYHLMDGRRDLFAVRYESPSRSKVWSSLVPYVLKHQTIDTPMIPSKTENQDGSDIHADHSKRD